MIEILKRSHLFCLSCMLASSCIWGRQQMSSEEPVQSSVKFWVAVDKSISWHDKQLIKHQTKTLIWPFLKAECKSRLWFSLYGPETASICISVLEYSRFLALQFYQRRTRLLTSVERSNVATCCSVSCNSNEPDPPQSPYEIRRGKISMALSSRSCSSALRNTACMRVV